MFQAVLAALVALLGREIQTMEANRTDILPNDTDMYMYMSRHESCFRLFSQPFMLCLSHASEIQAMLRSMSVGISTFLVLMAVFLGVGPLTLCARIHTPRKEEFVRLQAHMAHAGPHRWLKSSKPSMPSTMALTLVWVTPFVPLARALTVVWVYLVAIN